MYNEYNAVECYFEVATAYSRKSLLKQGGSSELKLCNYIYIYILNHQFM